MLKMLWMQNFVARKLFDKYSMNEDRKVKHKILMGGLV